MDLEAQQVVAGAHLCVRYGSQADMPKDPALSYHVTVKDSFAMATNIATPRVATLDLPVLKGSHRHAPRVDLVDGMSDDEEASRHSALRVSFAQQTIEPVPEKPREAPPGTLPQSDPRIGPVKKRGLY
jgi:hypothetical protein